MHFEHVPQVVLLLELAVVAEAVCFHLLEANLYLGLLVTMKMIVIVLLVMGVHHHIAVLLHHVVVTTCTIVVVHGHRPVVHVGHHLVRGLDNVTLLVHELLLLGLLILVPLNSLNEWTVKFVNWLALFREREEYLHLHYYHRVPHQHFSSRHST